jgi:hypothetical protein
MRYCDGEPGEFADSEFTHVRGNLYLHVEGRRPPRYSLGWLAVVGRGP